MSLRYVYGIVPARAARRLDEEALSGLDGNAVRPIVEGDLAAAASDVSEAEYGSEGLNEHVRDLEWLTPRAAAHQAVNAKLLEIADVVLPLSFGALYRDDDRVREMLRENADVRVTRLAALAGRAEWVVTVTRDPREPAGADEDLRELDHDIATSTPGRAFLLEKRRTAVSRSATERSDRETADRVLAALDEVAERTYTEPVAKGGGDVVVVRISLLVPRDDADRVDARIERVTGELSGEGYRVRASGPWPAYRFGALS